MKLPKAIAMRRAKKPVEAEPEEEVEILPEGGVEATVCLRGVPIGRVAVLPNDKRPK